MKVIKKAVTKARGIKFVIVKDRKIIGRAFLYLLYNDLHNEPFGLLEDVFVEESFRGQGWGTKLVEKVIKEAKKLGCYKLIATSRYSRPKIHEWYNKLGFLGYGREFRLDF